MRRLRPRRVSRIRRIAPTGICTRIEWRRGQVRKVPGGASQQAHRLDGYARRDEQPPFTRPVPETAIEALTAGFELVRAQHARLPGRQRQRDLAARSARPRIVARADRDRRRRRAGVDQPQPAPLACVARRVEEQHMPGSRRHGNRIVHTRQEPVRGTDIRRRPDVQVRIELQPPVALTVTYAVRQPPCSIAFLQVARSEMRRPVRIEIEHGRAEACAGIVNRVNPHRAGLAGGVDDAHEPLKAGFRHRRDQREGNWLRCPCISIKLDVQSIGAPIPYNIIPPHLNVVSACRCLGHGY